MTPPTAEQKAGRYQIMTQETRMRPVVRPGNHPTRSVWQRTMHRVRMFLMGGDWR